MKKGVLISALMCLLLMTSIAQVKGVVKDQNGNVLVGANVVWKGTNNGTITGIDGKFELKPQPEENEIVTSFVGYINDTTQWDGVSFVEISMHDGIKLDNVVMKSTWIIPTPPRGQNR